MMDIIPAIDLLGGKVVRLLKGDYAQVTTYADDPLALAAEWREHVRRLHVVDLEGAKSGHAAQRELIGRIVQAFGSGVQVGGGIRSLEAARHYFDAGVERVVLGTAALRDPELTERACQEFRGRVVIAVDARDGMVATDGWQQTSSMRAVELVQRFAAQGIAAVLYTDIDRDGTEVGPNVDATSRLAQDGGVPVIASGGVGTLDHLRALARAHGGIVGAIVGRALHEKRFTLEAAVNAATTEPRR
jgi:phosphoribosylformimino-5-aminoimidazole carboxamide ribotide isomerase